MDNGLPQNELNELMSYLGMLKSAVYVRTAPAARWNLLAEVDKITDEIVERATKYKVTCIRGEWFWDIVQFATSDTAGWHHQHKEGNHRFLHPGTFIATPILRHRPHQHVAAACCKNRRFGKGSVMSFFA